MKRVLVAFGLIAFGACGGQTAIDFDDDGGVDSGLSGGGGSVRRDGGIVTTDATTKRDVGTGVETGGRDTGGSTLPPPDCAPGSVSGFTPTWKAPAAFHQNKCTQAQIDSLVSCNFDDSADQTTCTKVLADAVNKDCNNCLFTASSASKLGPMVIAGAIASLNIAGCIANEEGNPTASSCGAKYQAASDCADEACDPFCPGDDLQGLKAKNACIQKALTSVCLTYSTAADCANALLDTGGAAEPCNAGNTFEEAAVALGKLFCGN